MRPPRPKARITGDRGVLRRQAELARTPTKRGLEAAAELRVAKQLRKEGESVHFLNEDPARPKNHDFWAGGRKTEVKRLVISRNFAKEVAKAARQVGDHGRVIIVRPTDAKAPISVYRRSVAQRNFVPRRKTDGSIIQNVEIRVVKEADLPKLNLPKKNR